MLMNPLSNAEREFEDHERELWNELMARLGGAVPPGATLQEAVEALQSAAIEDPGLEELVFRVLSMAQIGGGAFLRQKLEEPLPEPPGEPVYRLADQPTKALVQEEIRLLDRLHRGIEERVDAALEGDERQQRIHDLLNEDEELAALAERLDQLSRSHDESVMLGLARLTEEEEEAEGEG